MSHWRTLPRFLIVGVINSSIGLSAIYIAKGVLNYDDISANIFGYSFGLIVSYTLNRFWTFAHNGAFVKSVFAFLIVQGCAYFLNLASVLILIHYEVDSYIAQALGVLPYTIISYLGSRYFVFKLKK